MTFLTSQAYIWVDNISRGHNLPGPTQNTCKQPASWDARESPNSKAMGPEQRLIISQW